MLVLARQLGARLATETGDSDAECEEGVGCGPGREGWPAPRPSSRRPAAGSESMVPLPGRTHLRIITFVSASASAVLAQRCDASFIWNFQVEGRVGMLLCQRTVTMICAGMTMSFSLMVEQTMRHKGGQDRWARRRCGRRGR
eukprot:3131796-Rhodomonas_salina.2